MSTGNHGLALAYAAQGLGVRALICMSHLVPANKVEAIRSLAGGIGLENRNTFRMVQTLVDDTVLVSEDEIAARSPSTRSSSRRLQRTSRTARSPKTRVCRRSAR